MNDKNNFRFKSYMSKKAVLLFTAWTVAVYSFGAFFGWSYPDDQFIKVKKYAIMLEIENSNLNKKLKLCKSK